MEPASRPTDPASACSDLVAGPLPRAVVDVEAHLVLAANPAAARTLGLATSPPTRLDPAMPAWAALQGDFVSAAPVSLLWWTKTGPRPITGTAVAAEVGAQKIVVLTLAGCDGEGRTAAPTLASVPPPGGDLATLREIARRIRAGIAGESQGIGNDSGGTPRHTETTPPPLDFQPIKPSLTGTADRPDAIADDPADLAMRRLAHELRTPLGAIALLAEIMRDQHMGPLSERYRAYAGDIHETARHMLDVVAALLDGSGQSAAGLGALDLSPLDPGELAARCGSVMQPVAAREGVALVTKVSPQLPLVIGDHRAIRQVILNLLANALRHTAPGGSVTLAANLLDHHHAGIIVSDTGSGMTANELGRARGEARAGPARIRLAGEDGGSGFGLAIVREFMAAQNGTVSIDSIEGRGTTVTIGLPIADRRR